jgi:hypothetical protein
MDPDALPARGANPERSAGASLRLTDAAPTAGVGRLPGAIAAQRRF